MADTHGDAALQLALDQLRHQHPAALDPGMVVEHLHLAAALVHLQLDQGRHRTVVGDHRVVQLGRRISRILPVEQVEAGAVHHRLLHSRRAVAVLHRHGVERQALAHAIDDEVRLGPAPAVEAVDADAGDQAHLVGLLRQLGEGNRRQAVAGQLAVDPYRVFAAHHIGIGLAAERTAAPQLQGRRPQAVVEQHARGFAGGVAEIERRVGRRRRRGQLADPARIA
ncbi:hypothetical protein PAERUG_P54_1_London_24_VIM_2_04_13_03028 [Pseudomonas aeruginosa]|nr:hypothetical protein PAERUG_E16_London_17_VIM_2_04_14_01442 [Pseudomonas aeruginosa]CRW80504.1 hypothetical protein PAERUG_P63_London_25_VIM_2_03_14_01228 [Pseudomonas aeruginosa]CRX15536.1 hypothetical protein PAERUG_P54_1_London_24_VIM_2_04_13_03028 [Pseudomonas aeruginosa]